jgi:hypothetical protein
MGATYLSPPMIWKNPVTTVRTVSPVRSSALLIA